MAIELYREVTVGYPKDEQYGMVSQIKRAATSIPLNIAEGYGKWVSGKELVRFLLMARGSCCEMEVLLSMSKDVGYMADERYHVYAKRYEEVGRMLTGLIHSVTSATTNN